MSSNPATLAESLARFEREPHDHELAAHIATQCADRGDSSGTVRYLQRASAVASGATLSSYLSILGAATRDSAPDAALDCYMRATLADPRNRDAYIGAASICRDHGEHETSVDWLARAIETCEVDVEVCSELFSTLLTAHTASDAERRCRAIVGMRAQTSLYEAALADALMKRGGYAAAIDRWQRARRDSENLEPTIWRGLALCHERLDEPDAAGEWYGRARAAYPRDRAILRSYRMFLLRLGRHDEARQVTLDWTQAARPEAPRWWQGTNARRRSFVLDTTPGYGDMIQFVRFAECLERIGASRVDVYVSEPLKDLFESTESIDRVVVYHDDVIHADVREDLASVFLKLPTAMTVDSALSSYLKPPSSSCGQWSKAIGSSQYKVGFVWSCSQRGGDPHTDRNLPFPLAAPMLKTPGITFYSLQKGHGIGATLSGDFASDVVDLSSRLTSFAETAAATACLDLVVTVDTSVAHVAGAIGCPTAVLLPYHTDWRWCPRVDTSPWYPSMRLFRQRTPGVWDDPVRDLQVFLGDLAAPKTA